MTKDGFCYNLGMSCVDKRVYFVVYGATYSKIEDNKIERRKIKQKMINAVKPLTFDNEFVLIYIHTGTRSTKAGGLSLAK